MKKILAILLTVAVLCSMTTVGFAFSTDGAYTLTTTVSDVTDGKVIVSFFLTDDTGANITFEPNKKGNYNSDLTIQMNVNIDNCTPSDISVVANYGLEDYMTAEYVAKNKAYKILCEGIDKEIIVTKDTPMFVVTLPVTQTSAGKYNLFTIDDGETYFANKNAADSISTDDENITYAPATVSYEIKGAPVTTYTLTFEGVDGTYKTDDNGKLEGTIPTPDAKEGYTFAGWAVKGTTDVVDFATSTFSEDTTFVALWTKNHVAADKGTEYAEVKAYDDGFYYEGRYFFIANDDTVTNYGVSIKGAKDTKDFIGKNKVEGAAKVLYRIALLGDDEAALKAIVATPFINK